MNIIQTVILNPIDRSNIFKDQIIDTNDEMCRKYINEVETSVVRLEEIGDKFDNLLHELICLNEISEDPLHEMQNLIESTSDYKSIEDQ